MEYLPIHCVLHHHCQAGPLQQFQGLNCPYLNCQHCQLSLTHFLRSHRRPLVWPRSSQQCYLSVLIHTEGSTTLQQEQHSVVDQGIPCGRQLCILCHRIACATNPDLIDLPVCKPKSVREDIIRMQFYVE